MRIKFVYCIIMSMSVAIVLADKREDKWQHYLEARHDNTGLPCEDARGNTGFCLDDRADVSIDDGCFAKSKVCLEYNKCNLHMKCFVPWGLDLQEYIATDSCIDREGECEQPNQLYNSLSYHSEDLRVYSLCQCGYECSPPIYKPNCSYPSGCQLDSLSCGGTKVSVDETYNSPVCSWSGNPGGHGFTCCVAEGGDGACDNLNGVCQETKVPCNGWYVQGKCEGHHFRQCCIPPKDDTDCTDIPGATCLDTRIHACLNGDYRSGLCSGPKIRKCCIPGCPDFFTDPDTGLKQSYDCHDAGGCCRPYSCEGNEIELPNLCSDNCKCCTHPPPSPSKSSGSGDPNFYTLDKTRYRFDGKCSYVLLRECSHPLGSPRFTIINTHGLMQQSQGKVMTYIKSMSVIMSVHPIGEFRIDLLEGKYVAINRTHTIHITELGQWKDTDIGITVEHDGPNMKVDKFGEFTVWFNGNGRVNVAIDERYYGKVCGLLGNANDDPDDDFQKMTPHGLELGDDVDEFGHSWEVPNSCPTI